MMTNKFGLPNRVNETQRRFSDLCEKGGGVKGGPARPAVQKLLRTSGKLLNRLAYEEVATAFADNPGADPWKICFAVGLSWGHLAQLEPDFLTATIRCLGGLNDADLAIAKRHHLERGPEVLEQSIRGGYVLFQKVKLPDTLPTSLSGLRKAQDRWLSPIVSKDRPRYIGSWNASALFMIALFAQPALAATYTGNEIGLPPGGAIHQGLSILHKTHVLAKAPVGNVLDETEFEPGAIFDNTNLMMELLKGQDDWSMLDVHSAVYLLGTSDKKSDQWLDWTKAV